MAKGTQIGFDEWVMPETDLTGDAPLTEREKANLEEFSKTPEDAVDPFSDDEPNDDRECMAAELGG